MCSTSPKEPYHSSTGYRSSDLVSGLHTPHGAILIPVMIQNPCVSISLQMPLPTTTVTNFTHHPYDQRRALIGHQLLSVWHVLLYALLLQTLRGLHIVPLTNKIQNLDAFLGFAIDLCTFQGSIRSDSNERSLNIETTMS